MEERRWEEEWGDDRCGIENEDPPDEWWEKNTSPTREAHVRGFRVPKTF